jgi:ribosomal protein L34E
VLQLKNIRPSKLSNKHLSKKNKTVHRVYGGCLDHKVVRERYIASVDAFSDADGAFVNAASYEIT